MQTGLKSNYLPHSRWNSYWQRLADQMLRENLNPEACIWYVFQQRAQGEAPQPNQILLPRYMEAFKTLDERVRREIVAEFNANKQRFEVCVAMYTGQFNEPEETWEYVLGLDSEPFSPLFRHCVASSEQLAELADRFEFPATRQYLISPDAYDGVFGKLIPSAMKEQANEFRRS